MGAEMAKHSSYTPEYKLESEAPKPKADDSSAA